MESELLSAEEIEHVRTLAGIAADPNDVRQFSKHDAVFLTGLITRVANQAKLTNDQCNRTIKLLRLILKEVL